LLYPLHSYRPSLSFFFPLISISTLIVAAGKKETDMLGVISGIALFVAFVFREEIFLIIRKLVSQEKKRFQKDNFDLDLTYITDRIIGMNQQSSLPRSFTLLLLPLSL
jgi:hypothetical protein